MRSASPCARARPDVGGHPPVVKPSFRVKLSGHPSSRFDEGARNADRNTRGRGATWPQPLGPLGIDAVALAGLGGLAMPYLSRAADRPRIEGGIASGDVAADSAVIWARADRAARMVVECATDDSFKAISWCCFGGSLAGLGFHVEAAARTGCLPGRIFSIACAFENIVGGRRSQAKAQVGHFRTAPVKPPLDLVRLVRRHRRAGLGHRYERAAACAPTRTMLDNRPDFFIHSGDTSTRDCPIEAELKLPDGKTLAEYRHRRQSRRSRTDASRSFAATTNITCSTRICAPSTRRCPMLRAVGRSRGDQRLVADRHRSTTSGYAEESTFRLVARAARAFHEFMPMRSTPAAGRPRSIARSAYGPLLDVFLIDMRSYRGLDIRQARATAATPASWGRTQTGVAEARACAHPMRPGR